jgi:hypothetical protein
MPPRIQSRAQPRICPHCEAEIEHLNYRCDIYSSRRGYGTADFDGDVLDEESDGEYEDDSSDNYVYVCPECDEEVGIGDLIAVEESDEEGTESTPTPAIDKLLDRSEPGGRLIDDDKEKLVLAFRCDGCGSVSTAGERNGFSIADDDDRDKSNPPICARCDKEMKVINS